MKLTDAEWQKINDNARVWMEARKAIDAVLAQRDQPAAGDAEVVGEAYTAFCKSVSANGVTMDGVAEVVSVARRGMVPAGETFSKEQIEKIGKAINDEGEKISWQGFGAETTFAVAVLARLTTPAKPTAEERVTIVHASGVAAVYLDHAFQVQFGHENPIERERCATIYRLGLIAELKGGKA